MQKVKEDMLKAYQPMQDILDKMKKPNVDLIEGLSPAISIEQKNTSKKSKINGSYCH